MNTGHKKKGDMMRELILNAIIGYIQEHGYPPTYEEIGEMVGLKSKCTINSHIKRMLIDGDIETDSTEKLSPRAIRVPGYKLVKETVWTPKPYGMYAGKCKCGVVFLDRKTNYCGNCGIKLNWKGKNHGFIKEEN